MPTGFPLTIATTDRSLQNPRGTARPNRIVTPTISGSVPGIIEFALKYYF
ncbi:MAG: hypothetical protein JST85_13310 [Acidobacteria bacterium]|nr:hypothetical protein [Acidobacteriota bacterium]